MPPRTGGPAIPAGGEDGPDGPLREGGETILFGAGAGGLVIPEGPDRGKALPPVAGGVSILGAGPCGVTIPRGRVGGWIILPPGITCSRGP